MEYDYIIAGAGASGLSLLHYLLEDPELSQKRILLLDKARKAGNDRTWCFWETGEGPFEHLLTARWDHLQFHSPDFSDTLHIAPYRYKMLRSKDFYGYCLGKLEAFPNVEYRQEEIQGIEADGTVHCGARQYRGGYVFSSLPQEPEQSPKNHCLLQHFKGWFIKTPDPAFTPEAATLMDFRIPQEGDCRFVYVLPLNDREALVEYTAFSAQLLEQGDYDERLTQYLKQYLQLKEYQIQEREFGVIPMTNAAFPKKKGDRVYFIGTAGGHTKASTGYTFQFIQRECQQIAARLRKGLKPVEDQAAFDKYYWYDSLFLRVLEDRKVPPHTIFSAMFGKLPPHLPLKFLEESTSFLEDLRVMNVVNKAAFLQAAVQEASAALFSGKPMPLIKYPVVFK